MSSFLFSNLAELASLLLVLAEIDSKKRVKNEKILYAPSPLDHQFRSTKSRRGGSKKNLSLIFFVSVKEF